MYSKMSEVDTVKFKEFVIQYADQEGAKQSSTLVLMYGFYGASDRVLQKYSAIYHGYGFDVLPIKSRLKHFARPSTSGILAERTLDYLQKHCDKYEHLLVHAFSMGAYNVNVCSEKMVTEQPKYDNIRDKIRAVVYDSLALGSLQGMLDGIATVVSKNAIVRWLLPKAMKTYFIFTRCFTVDVINHALEFSKDHPINAPTLSFYCTNDRLSNWEVVELYIKEWRDKSNVSVHWKRWDESKHSAHLLMHEVEYRQTLDEFISLIPNLPVMWHSKL